MARKLPPSGVNEALGQSHGAVLVLGIQRSSAPSQCPPLPCASAGKMQVLWPTVGLPLAVLQRNEPGGCGQLGVPDKEAVSSKDEPWRGWLVLRPPGRS